MTEEKIICEAKGGDSEADFANKGIHLCCDHRDILK